MNSIRKWLYKPKKTDQSLLAQFFYADEDLNKVAAELDSFDGRKDPDRCTALVNHLRQCQDKVLNICQMIMDEVILEDRAPRDFRAKFPDDVLQENLAGQLWFGAECLAAGSSILNRELESATMRPLAKALTKSLENVRNLLREQCFRNPPEFTEKICESLKILDRLFAEFELSYVSAMVPVKTVHEYEAQQAITVLFSETLQRALHLKLLAQDQVDSCDPALMFTIPRLAIVAGLLIFPDGPLCLNQGELSDLFRPFRSLLLKIRELLWTLNRSELTALERALCSVDEPSLEPPSMVDDSSNNHNNFSNDPCNQINQSPPRHHHHHHHHRHHSQHHHHHHHSHRQPHQEQQQQLQQSSVVSYVTTATDVPIGPHAIHDYVDQLFKDFPSCKEFISDICCNNNNNNNNNSNNNHHNNNNNNQNHNNNNEDTSISQYSMNQTSGLLDGSRHHLDFQNDFEPIAIAASPHNNHNSNNHANSSSSYSSSYSSFGENTGDQHSPNSNSCEEDEEDEEVDQAKSRAENNSNSNTSEDEEVEIDDSGTEDTVKDLIQFMDKSQTPPCPMKVRTKDEGEGEQQQNKDGDVNSGSGSSSSNCAAMKSKLRNVYGTSNSFSYDDQEEDNSNSDNQNRDVKSVDDLTNCNSSSSNSCSNSSSCCSLAVEEGVVVEEGGNKDQSHERPTEFFHKQHNHHHHHNQNQHHPTKLNLSNRSFSYDNADDASTPVVEEIKAALVESRSKFNSLRSSSSSHDSGLSSMAETSSDKSDKLSTSLNGNTSTSSSDTSSSNNNNNNSSINNSNSIHPEGSSSTSSSSPSSSACLVTKEITSPINSESSNVGNSATSLVKQQQSFLQVPDHQGMAMESQRRRSSNQEMFPCSGSCCNSECSASIAGESTCETSSFDSSECQDDIEIALAMQAAEIATRNEARSRFKNSADLIHRLFICISGVADQLQTNYASDLRSTLKCVFAMNATPSEDSPSSGTSLDLTPEPSLNEENMHSVEEHSHQINVDNGHHHHHYQRTEMIQPPTWIPDELAPICMACQSAFTFFHRRHHCRSCGGVFCNTCSDYVMTLPLSPKPARVCSACYTALSGERVPS